ncbi:MAG: NAD-binding protein, partial [Sedimenticola sp.]|nr:NAD-binding protein [Sedimenticola sp.]
MSTALLTLKIAWRVGGYSMRDSVIIFGSNSLSSAVAMQLKERDWDLLLVSSDDAALAKMASRGFNTQLANYSDDDELMALGIGRGVGVIFAFFEEDSENVFLTISAKSIDPDIKVISLTQSSDSARKLKAAGASKVIDPYEISGRKVYDMIKRPLIAETIEKVVYGQDYLNLAEITVAKGSFMDGQMLGDLRLSSRYDLIVLGVVDRELGDEFIFASSGLNHKLDAG